MTTTDTPTDTSSTEAPTAEAPETSTTAEETTTAPEAGHEDPSKLRGEAAKWRSRLRETETERDQLRAQLEAARRGEVERVAADHLASPADVWIDDDDLDALLDEAGTVDPAKVAERLDGILEARPGLAVTGPAPMPRSPRSSIGASADLSSPLIERDGNGKTWADVLGARR